MKLNTEIDQLREINKFLIQKLHEEYKARDELRNISSTFFFNSGNFFSAR